MKKLLILLSVLLVTEVFSVAQISEQETDLMRSILKSEVKVFFAQNIHLQSSETTEFWEIYDLYEKELLPIGNERVALLKKIIGEEGMLDSKEVDQLIGDAIKVDRKRRDIRAKYYKIYKKKMGVGVAAQFYQLDAYINMHVGAALLESSPILLPK